METLCIGLCQITSTDQPKDNYLQMRKVLESIPSGSGVRLVCFPENCLFMRLKEGGPLEVFDLSSPYLLGMAEWAKDTRTNIHLGSIPLRQGNQVFNGSVLIQEDGSLISSYNKMHLFDISLDQGPSHLESDSFSHGEGPRIFEIDGWKIGQTICYDLRFAELFSYYAKQEVDLVLVPSSFLVKTGRDHWNILLRARAIESQCYVLASAQSGMHRGDAGVERETFGHSLAVDPWGGVMDEILDSPRIKIVDLTKSVIEKVRRQIPMKSQRRIF